MFSKEIKNKIALEDIDVVILCGGKGKRLREVVRGIPKPMASVSGKPFLELIIRYLSNFGLNNFVLATGYKGESISRYFKSISKNKIKLVFSREKKVLGTGGAVKNASKFIKSSPFFVFNGDSFCEFDPRDFLSFHIKNHASVTILLAKVRNGSDYAEVKIDQSNRIVRFREKNKMVKSSLINSGVYLFNKSVLKKMPSNRKFSLEKEFFPKILNEKILGYHNQGFFIDIGTPERYLKANIAFKKFTSND